MLTNAEVLASPEYPKAIAKAHEKFDPLYFCPKCHRLLTGLHMASNCYANFIAREARKIVRAGGVKNET